MSQDREVSRQRCERLVEEFYKPIYQFCAHLARDRTVDEDLTQETFASVWANVHQLRDLANPKAWLHRIAYRKFVDAGRKRTRRAAAMNILRQNTSQESTEVDPLSQLICDECVSELLDAMGRLGRAKHLVILLHYIQQLTYREMAEVLDEPIGTVKWRTGIALTELRARLNGRT